MIVRKKKIDENGVHGMIITFSVNSDECKKPSDKTKFFKKLYGWTQKVPGKKKEYEYKREGVLDEMPHMRISPSSFIVPEEDFDKIERFFEEWQKKVIFNAFKVMIEDKSIFDEFDKFQKVGFQQEDDEEGEEGEDGDQEGEDEQEDGTFSEEESAIAERYREWQKAKKKLGSK